MTKATPTLMIPNRAERLNSSSTFSWLKKLDYNHPGLDDAVWYFDGSMLNGLNILPSYTDYFKLNAATTGLNTASVFIGGFFGPIFAGVFADRFGRRPAIFWGSAVTLIGVLLQTAAQNVAMFVVARIVLGFGSAVSGIAGGVYLSETFPSRWRAWGVGLLNDFY